MSLNIMHLTAAHANAKQPSIHKIIQRQGFRYKAASFNDALTLFPSSHPYDALIVEGDRSTLMDYLTLLKGLRLEEQFIPPFIVVSDQDDFELQALFFDLGAMGFMSYDNFNSQRFITYLYAIKKDQETLATLRGFKVAVVDDSRLSLAVLKDYFTKLQVTSIDLYQHSGDFINVALAYDLVIVDLVMPEFSGEDLIQHIRSKQHQAIILLMSAYSDSPVISHCLKIGADDFIIKPLDFRLFTLRLQNAISNHMLTQINMTMTEKLYQMATRDSLTGAFNRSYFIEYLDQRLSELNRKPEEFSALLIDIDHFKMVNDDFGHLKGDRVLAKLCEELSINIRESDILCRWGGEEFVVLLPNTGIVQAGIVAEKLRSAIEKTNFGLGRQVHISVGVTEFQSQDSRETLFRRLDNSLYLAKLTGRNKVVLDEELQIIRSGLPVSIEWGPFFRSGHSEVDKDHETLISLSNEIIVHCFRDNNEARIQGLFTELLNETQRHFENEEQILHHHRYEKLEEHKRIHADLLVKTKHLYEQLLEGQVSSVNLAKYIIQDVVVGHIIKSDFEFYDALRIG